MSAAEEELFRRLQEGLPAGEAFELLRRAEEERARRNAPAGNPFKFEDERLQKFSDLWFSQCSSASVEQKDRIGTAYMSKVLALGDEVARRFVRGDPHAYDRVGLRQGGPEHYVPDLEGFWDEVEEIFPNTYSKEDIRHLVEKGGVPATRHLLWQIEIPQAEMSKVLRRLAVNAHVFR